MKSTLQKSLLTMVALLCSIGATAEDFTVDNIHYNITDQTNKTVEVTYYNDDYFIIPDDYKYTGEVVIPESVIHEGTTYSVTKIGEHAFWNSQDLTSVSIPNSVTEIGEGALAYCKNLTKTNIPDGVTSIGNSAFEECLALTEIIIPNSVTSLGNSAFDNCKSLKEVTIGNGITLINDYTFMDCSSLTEITIPNGVTFLGVSAFYNCTSLAEVTIPNSVTKIGFSAFEGTPYYENMSDGVIYINNVLYIYKGMMPANTIIEVREGTVSISGDAFMGCDNLVKITIPNGVTSIGWMTFASCSGLTEITIPETVNELGTMTFYGCSGLKDVYCFVPTPLEIGKMTFSQVAYSQATLHVVSGCKEAYSSAEHWSNFTNITDDLAGIDGIEADYNNITVINGRLHIEGAAADVAVNIYNASGALVQQTTVGEVSNVALPCGLYLVQVGNMVKKVVM